MADHTFVVTDDNFQEKVVNSNVPVLVDFWAPWCGPCVALGPVLDQLAKDNNGKILVGKMNVDENANVPATFGVRSIPYVVMFKGGKMVGSVVGNVPKQKLQDMINSATTA